MKIRVLWTVIAFAIGLQTLSADDAPQSIEIEALPDDPKSFVELRNELAGTPEGGAAIFILAMMKFVEDPEVGEKFMTIALDRGNLKKSAKGYKGYRPGNSLQYHLNRLRKLTHLPASYVAGTSPQNGYAAAAPYRFEFSRNKYSEIKPTRIKVFVACSGASSPRPVTLRRNDRGVWKVAEASSLFVGVAAPVSDDGDDI
ncbi:MAG: hypothetical protein NXI24_12180 [bacterium]|nr:hypothetical protein [bacterium]